MAMPDGISHCEMNVRIIQRKEKVTIVGRANANEHHSAQSDVEDDGEGDQPSSSKARVVLHTRAVRHGASLLQPHAANSFTELAGVRAVADAIDTPLRTMDTAR